MPAQGMPPSQPANVGSGVIRTGWPFVGNSQVNEPALSELFPGAP
jgi:hypothetical protein